MDGCFTARFHCWLVYSRARGQAREYGGSDSHDDLADLSVRLHVAMSFDDLVESEGLSDAGEEGAGLQVAAGRTDGRVQRVRDQS